MILFFIVFKWKICYYYNYIYVYMLYIYFDFMVIMNLLVVGNMIFVFLMLILIEKCGSIEIWGKIFFIYGKYKIGYLEVYIMIKYINNCYYIFLF